MPDNESLIVAGRNIRKISMATGETLQTYQTSEYTLQPPYAVSNNGKLLAVNTSNCKIIVFDTQTGQVTSPAIRVAEANDYSYVRTIAFSPGDVIIHVGESKQKTYRSISLLNYITEKVQLGSTPLSIAQNSKYLVIGHIFAFNDGANLTVSTVSNNKTFELTDKYSVTSIACHPTNNELIATGTLGTLKGGVGIWDFTKNQQKVMKGHTAQINALAFSPDGKFIISGSGDMNPDPKKPDFTVRMWDTEKMKQIRIFEE